MTDKQESGQVALAREMMTMLREFVEPLPEGEGDEKLYENLAPDYVHELAKGAALLIDATAPTAAILNLTGMGISIRQTGE